MSADGAKVALLTPELRSRLAWARAAAELRRGESPRDALLRALHDGAGVPTDLAPEERAWLVEALAGEHEPTRERGRPRKRESYDQRYRRAIVEAGILEAYEQWRELFARDREAAWLSAEALRLHDRHPEADVWRRPYDLGEDEDHTIAGFELYGRRSYRRDLEALGACPCPPAQRGGESPHELALKATARARRDGWLALTGERLTVEQVRHAVTRARRQRAQ